MIGGLLSINEVVNIPKSLMPAFVLSDNARSLLGLLIRKHTEGSYNHFMLMKKPGMFVTQDWTFKEVRAENYLQGKFRLKIWVNTKWGHNKRKAIIDCIEHDLGKPWYKRLYDPIAIVGQALGLEWLQIPGQDICSDKASYLSLVDPRYDLTHPDPTDVNQWLEEEAAAKRGYEVFGRYVPD